MIMEAFLRADLRLARRWFLAALIALGLVFLLTLLPNLFRSANPNNLDKVAHFLGFMGLMILFGGVLVSQVRVWLFLFLAACGGIIELLQIPVPGRSAEIADMYADLLGLAVGWLIVRAGVADWCVWIEKRMGLA